MLTAASKLPHVFLEKEVFSPHQKTKLSLRARSKMKNIFFELHDNLTHRTVSRDSSSCGSVEPEQNDFIPSRAITEAVFLRFDALLNKNEGCIVGTNIISAISYHIRDIISAIDLFRRSVRRFIWEWYAVFLR